MKNTLRRKKTADRRLIKEVFEEIYSVRAFKSDQTKVSSATENKKRLRHKRTNQREGLFIPFPFFVFHCSTLGLPNRFERKTLDLKKILALLLGFQHRRCTEVHRAYHTPSSKLNKSC